MPPLMMSTVLLCVGTAAFDGLFLSSQQGHIGSCGQIATKSPFTQLAQTALPLDIIHEAVPHPAEKLAAW